MSVLIRSIVVGALLSLDLHGPTIAGAIEDGLAAYRRGDYATAFQSWRSLAEQGNARAEADLGVLYRLGQGVRRDDAEAVKWLRKAAEQGDAAGQAALAEMYVNGHGVPRDFALALAWYRKAAEQGEADAQYDLGMMYDKGEGVERDVTEAAKWYRKAADQGNSDARSRSAALSAALLDRALARFHSGLSIQWDSRTGVTVDPVMSNLDLAIELTPDSIQARQLRGEVRFLEGDYGGALTDYDRAISLKPDDPLGLTGRALVRAVANQDLDLALSDCDRVLSSNHMNVQARFSRAMVWYRKGEFQKAYADFDAAYSLNHALHSALYGRALSEAHLNRKAEADADLEKVMSVDPNVAGQFSRWKIPGAESPSSARSAQ